MSLLDTIGNWQTENPNAAYLAGVLVGAAIILPVSHMVAKAQVKRLRRKVAVTIHGPKPEVTTSEIDTAVNAAAAAAVTPVAA